MVRLQRTIRFALLAAFVMAGPKASHGQSFPPDADVQAILDQRVEEGRATGIVVGLLEADGTRRFFSAGSSGPGAAPLSAESVFEIGSITKVFTGILLAEMSLKGEVSLEDPVQRHLPSEVTIPVRNGRAIRLVDLSTHRSSLPRLPANLFPPDLSNPYAHYSVDSLYSFLNGHELTRDIGSEGEYSNLAVGLLGHTLALVAGMNYEGLAKERILDPLGMAMSGITLSESMKNYLALGHGAGGDVVPNWDLPTLAGAGALRSNAEDMLTFLEANIGEPETRLEEAMRLAHEPREDLGGGRIGLNWITRPGEEVSVVWHNGGTGGYRTFAGFDPDGERGVVVLTNSTQGADDIGFHLLDPSSPLTPAPAAAEERTEVEVAEEILADYVGVYELAPNFQITVTLQNGRLRAQATDQGRYSIFPESETRFFYKVVDAQITFERDGEGVVTGLILHQGGQDTPGRKVE